MGMDGRVAMDGKGRERRRGDRWIYSRGLVLKIDVGVICEIPGVFGVLVGKVGLEGIVYKHYFFFELRGSQSEIRV